MEQLHKEASFETLSLDEHKAILSPSVGAALVPGKPVNLALKAGRAPRRNGRPLSKGGKPKRLPSLPPQISAVVTVSHRYRFQASAAASAVAVTVGTLVGACGGIGTVSNSTIACWASSVRVRQVTIWPGTPSNNPNTTEIIWGQVGTSYTKDESKLATIPTGVTVDRPVSERPPKDSLASFWLSAATSGTVMTITCGPGSVVDVDLTFTLANNFASVNITGLAAVLVNVVYYLRLDGVGGKFVPLGLPTTN